VSPTDSIIEANTVNVNVEKDYLGNIIVTFQGGNGLQQVNKIDVTLNRADGQVKTSDVGIRVGDTVTLEGTKNTDRVIVYVTMKDGKRYKIVDSLMPFRPRT
jgi:subtilisin-like proprotein convertase family protein